MGRPGLTQNRKFRRLALLLGSEVAARGHLELMWESAYEAGDEALGDYLDVELAARWVGEPGKLAGILSQVGFLDKDGDIYRVHDFWHHAPAYVRKRRHRENLRRSKVDPCLVKDQSVTSHRLDPDQKTAPLPHPHPHPHLTDNPPSEGPGGDEKPSVKKPKKEPKVPEWQVILPKDVLDVVAGLREFWPDPGAGDLQPADRTTKRRDPVPRTKWPEVARRLVDIKAKGGDMDVCLAIGRRFVSEYRVESNRVWMKAAQYFFGKSEDAPWWALYQAEITNAALDLEAVEA